MQAGLITPQQYYSQRQALYRLSNPTAPEDAPAPPAPPPTWSAEDLASLAKFGGGAQTPVPDVKPPAAPAFDPTGGAQGFNPAAANPLTQQEGEQTPPPGAYDNPPAVKKPRLTAAPAQGAPGATEAQPGVPGAAPFVMGAIAGRGGSSKADRDYAAQLQAQAQTLGGSIDDAVAQNREATAAFKAQSDALASESAAGAAKFAQSQQDNAEHAKALASEANEAQTRVDARLADLQAQGIDPNRYWQNRSTGEKLGAAALVGLGAIAAGPLGPHGQRGDNVALQMINGAVRDELDAQRTNLSKSIEVAKMQGESTARGFEQQQAMLRAERESGQTAYSIAQTNIQQRLALFKDNAVVQQQGAELLKGLIGEKAKFVEGINERLYRLHKAGEAVGGPTQVITTLLKNGQQWSGTVPQYQELVKAGLAEDESLAGAKIQSEVIKNMTGGGASKLASNPTMVKQRLALEDALRNIAKIEQYRTKHGGGTLSPTDRDAILPYATRAQEQALIGLGSKAKSFLDRQGHLLPDQPLELQWSGLFGADPNGAKISSTKEMLQDELNNLNAQTGAAPEPPPANDNPAGGTEDKEGD